MKLEAGLAEYFNEALTLDDIYACETSFYRALTENELSYMNDKLKRKHMVIICFPCDTCKEYSKGKEPYHIDRIRG